MRELNILKYYRLTRKWVCKTYGLKDADLELYVRKDGVVADDKVTLTCTRGKLQEVMHEIASAINGYTHSKAPLKVMCDAATTTVNASSIEGNDQTKSAIFFSDDVTAVAIAQSGY